MPGPNFQSQLVSHDSVKSIEALSQVSRPESDVDSGRRSKPKPRSELLHGSNQAGQSLGVKISPDLNPPAFSQQHLQSAAALRAKARSLTAET
jgi:hypothetical protein